MAPQDKDNDRFIRQHILCNRIGTQGTPVGFTHLSRLARGQTWKRSDMRARPTLCHTGDPWTLAPIDRDEPFDPRRDLPTICPDCRAAYEAEARLRLGMKTERLVF